MLLNKYRSKQEDFVLAYPQADVECDLYMDIPQGFNIQGSTKDKVLKLKKNLYGQKQAGRVWNKYLHDGLIARGFVQSDVDMCIYYRNAVTLMIYVDDGIFIGPTDEEIQECYNLLCQDYTEPSTNQRYKAFRLTDEGDLSDYLGVQITPLQNGLIKLTQPHLIQQILIDLGFNDRTGTKETPAAPTIRLSRDVHGEDFKEHWNYWSVIGKLNFLEKSTRLDIAYAVHQCARFSADPKTSHAAAVKRIGKYLNGTKDKGMILNPTTHSFDCWVDADFVGNWDRVNADVDPSTAKSRTAFIITYGGCPLTWASKIQREVALSSTGAEYIALSESLRTVIHLMQLTTDAAVLGNWQVCTAPPQVHCKVFEDNSGALEMARLPKMRPRPKHLCVKLHHFREHVRNKSISIHKIPTRYQLADIATKPQPKDLYQSQHESLLQWESEQLTHMELKLPVKHLRACEIIQALQAGTLNMDSVQHASQDVEFPQLEK